MTTVKDDADVAEQRATAPDSGTAATGTGDPATEAAATGTGGDAEPAPAAAPVPAVATETAGGGTTGADDTATDTGAASSTTDADPPAPDRRGGLVLPAVVVVVALLVAALGAWFLTRAADARDEQAAANTALVDTATTAEVSAAVTSALNRVFSYSHAEPEVTERAAAEVLRGPALATYEQLFAQVRQLAPEQRIVLTTRVVHIAVQSVAGDRAKLLVFLDQSAARADDGTTSSGAAQLSVTAERQGDTWLIIDLTPR